MRLNRKPKDWETKKLCNPELSQLPIQDLAIINFISENDLGKYYTADLESVPYGVVELMLDTRSLCRNMSKHRIRSYQDELVLDYEYLESEIVFPDNKAYIPIVVAADIMNLTLEQILELAQKDGELYFDDHDNPNVISNRWLVSYLGETVKGIGGTANEITLGNNGQGRIKIIIKKELK